MVKVTVFDTKLISFKHDDGCGRNTAISLPLFFYMPKQLMAPAGVLSAVCVQVSVR